MGYTGWINVAQDGDLCRTFMCTRVLLNTAIFLSSWATADFSGRTQLHGVTS
jgi:hypothetical protein